MSDENVSAAADALYDHLDRWGADKKMAYLISELIDAKIYSALSEPEKPVWSSDLSEVPRDRDFLVQFNHGEVTIGHYLDNSKTDHPWEGIRPVRTLRPWKIGEKIVAWREIPTAETTGFGEALK